MASMVTQDKKILYNYFTQEGYKSEQAIIEAKKFLQNPNNYSDEIKANVIPLLKTVKHENYEQKPKIKIKEFIIENGKIHYN